MALPSKTAQSRGFLAGISIHSAQMVNVGFPAQSGYGFERVDVKVLG
jgi:hypothetical protein